MMTPCSLLALISKAGSHGRSFASRTQAKGKLITSKAKQPPVDERLLPVVAIVGKPNVGKSALFNRLVQRADALVKDTPDDHVTRDYQSGRGRLGDLNFKVFDTSGLEPFMASDSIQARATNLTMVVLQQADTALYLADAKAGITKADYALVKWLTRIVKMPVILAANKAELANKGVDDTLIEAVRLGQGVPIAISAETGEGMVELYNELRSTIDSCAEERRKAVEWEKEQEEADVKNNEFGIAVVGLPNVGKSTLMNWLLGSERSLTGPEPGLTRDAVTETMRYRDYKIRVTDTAGWLDHSRLKHSALGGQLAESAQTLTQRSFNRAQVVLLMIDALTASQKDGVTRRELALASNVIAEGRALVVLMNKFDAVPDHLKLEVTEKIEAQLKDRLAEVSGAACLTISALNGQGLEGILPAAVDCYTVWNQRVTTGRLNAWLAQVAKRYAIGGGATQIARVKYVTQVNARPPKFVAFLSGSQPFPEPSSRFFTNALREEFGFEGVPLRIEVRKKESRWKPKPRASNSAKRSTASRSLQKAEI